MASERSGIAKAGRGLTFARKLNAQRFFYLIFNNNCYRDARRRPTALVTVARDAKAAISVLLFLFAVSIRVAIAISRH